MAYGSVCSGMATFVRGAMRATSFGPHGDDTDSMRCLVDYILDLNTFVFGLASTGCSFRRSCLRCEFVRAFYAELCHHILKLDPIRDV